MGDVTVDIEGLLKARDKLQQISDGEINTFMAQCAKELAARLLAKVVKRTPVGQYSNGTGKKGGTLRRGWTNNTSQGVSTYVNTLSVHQIGTSYVIEIINPVEYASYVEYGHRTRGGKGWVPGQLMMTISEEEIRQSSQKILETKINKFLGGIL